MPNVTVHTIAVAKHCRQLLGKRWPRWWWRWRTSQLREWAARKIAWHLPRRVVTWCAVRVMAHATTGLYENPIGPDLTVMDALNRWDPQ